MARPVHFFEPTWFDRDFRKQFQSLPVREQEERLGELDQLSRALSSCRHPASDPALATWRPTSYHVHKVEGLFEYRCKFPMRVIARWIDPSETDAEGVVLLVAVTLSHDHRRLKEIIERNRADVRDWTRE